MTGDDHADVSRYAYSKDQEMEKLGLNGYHGEQGYEELARRSV